MNDSYYLFAKPSFIEGMARVLDLGNTLNVYNESPTDVEADSMALYLDWALIGNDISQAISENREINIVGEKTK
jgi:hypothetical protein